MTPAARWPDPAAPLESYAASGQLPVRQRGPFCEPKGGPDWMPIDTEEDIMELSLSTMDMLRKKLERKKEELDDVGHEGLSRPALPSQP